MFTVDNSSALLERLESLQTRIIEGNVRLIILDSVAALARRVSVPMILLKRRIVRQPANLRLACRLLYITITPYRYFGAAGNPPDSHYGAGKVQLLIVNLIAALSRRVDAPRVCVKQRSMRLAGHSTSLSATPVCRFLHVFGDGPGRILRGKIR